MLRRLSDAERKENIKGEEKDLLDTQHAIQGQIMSRSKTVLLKSADHKDQENELRYVHLLCLHFYVVLAARATDVLGRRNLVGSICNFVYLYLASKHVPDEWLLVQLIRLPLYIYYLQVSTNVVTFSWTL